MRATTEPVLVAGITASVFAQLSIVFFLLGCAAWRLYIREATRIASASAKRSE